MSDSLLVFEPAAPAGKEPARSRQPLEGLAGKTIGFIDNAKPNFHYLVDDVAERLVKDYGAAGVVKHRKRGQVPAGDAVMAKLAEECDAVVAGSGD